MQLDKIIRRFKNEWIKHVFCGKRKEKSALEKKDDELATLEAEAKKIAEAEALVDKQNAKQGEQKQE